MTEGQFSDMLLHSEEQSSRGLVDVRSLWQYLHRKQSIWLSVKQERGHYGVVISYFNFNVRNILALTHTR